MDDLDEIVRRAVDPIGAQHDPHNPLMKAFAGLFIFMLAFGLFGWGMVSCVS